MEDLISIPPKFGTHERERIEEIIKACKKYPKETTFTGSAFTIFGSMEAWEYISTYIDVKVHEQKLRKSGCGNYGSEYLVYYILSFRFKKGKRKEVDKD